MKKYYCPICGYKLNESYTLGIICSCCGNECGCQDSGFIKYEVDMVEYDKIATKLAYLGLNGHDVLKEVHEFSEKTNLPHNDVWAILRQEWVKKNCKFKWTEDKPKGWGLKKAQEQLLNIGVNLNDVLKVQYKYHRR